MSTETKPLLVRVHKVGHLLDCSVSKVYKLIDEGKLKKIQLGPRTSAVTMESIEKFLQECGL